VILIINLIINGNSNILKPKKYHEQYKFEKHCNDVSWGQFHQRSTSSVFVHRAQKYKKDSQVISLFTLSGSEPAKVACKHVGEIDPQSFQPFS